MEPTALATSRSAAPAAANTRDHSAVNAAFALAVRPDLNGRAAAVQRKTGASASNTDTVHQVAETGIRGGGGALPHKAKIQASFGRYDVSGIRAHTDDAASAASRAIGATAYASGSDVAFDGAPDLHTAAHEAAHVVQQQHGVQLKGGVGTPGDHYERHADAVADRVVAGESAEALLDQVSGAAPGAQRVAATGGPVQMYTTYENGVAGINDAVRLSDDGKMMVKDSEVFPEGSRALQVAWAEPQVITDSAAELERVGSGYRLERGGGAITVDAPDHSGQKTLERITASNLANRTEGDNMTTPQNCNSNMGIAMGLTQTEGGADRENMRAQMGKRHRWNRKDDEDVEKTYSATTYNTSQRDARALLTGASNNKANAKYGNLSEEKRSKRGQYTHLNTGAKAGIGGGYAVFSENGGDHFTPIVAASGGDEISLEAHAQDDTNKNNFANWYFRMYGPAHKGQSYYEEYRDATNDKAGDYLGTKNGAGNDGPQRGLTVVAFQKVVDQPANAGEANAAKQRYFTGQTQRMNSLVQKGTNWAAELDQANAGTGARLAAKVARIQARATVNDSAGIAAAHKIVCTVRDELLALGNNAESREKWFLNTLLSCIDGMGQRVLEVKRLDQYINAQAND